jgi:hypothetical protein
LRLHTSEVRVACVIPSASFSDLSLGAAAHCVLGNPLDGVNKQRTIKKIYILTHKTKDRCTEKATGW